MPPPVLAMMDRKATIAIAALLPALLLQACDSPADPPTAVEAPAAPSPAAAPPAPPTPAPGAPSGQPPGYTAGSGINEGYPDLAPTPLVPEAERTETGARNLLLAFARAVELKEFDQAWAMLSPADRRKWTKAQFTKLFADLGPITAAVPGGTMEGAAGSSYYTAPVTITANDREGRPVRIEGEAVLRRVNDIDGASAAQLNWHFHQLTLDWTH